MSTKNRCQAKDPSKCPYHGTPPVSSLDKKTVLVDKISNLFTGTPQYFPPFMETDGPIKTTITITPVNKNAASAHTFTIENDNWDDLVQDVETKLGSLGLKDYKSGYQGEMYTSAGTGVVRKDFISTYGLSAKETTAPSSAKITAQALNELKETQKYNENFNEIVNELKDSKIAQSNNGAKTIAVVEAMNEFSFFEREYQKEEVHNVVHSFLNHTREYTNRGCGIRVWLDYDHKGEIREAKFGLDNPTSSWNVFTQADVDMMNSKLKTYFKKFD